MIAGTGSDFYSAITGGIGALRGPKHGGANEAAFDIQKRYASPDEAEADIRRRGGGKEVIIGFGHPVYTISDPRNVVIKRVAHAAVRRGRQRRRCSTSPSGSKGVMADGRRCSPNLDWFSPCPIT